ncbi:MAG: hypothetical protein ABI551_05065 [Polyangiaceae bacterium]
MKTTKAMAGGAMAMILATTACTRTLPPPAAPAHEMPNASVEVPPEVEGQATVVVDVTNGPARVDEVIAQEAAATSNGVVAYGELTRNVCLTTPCAVNLDYGQHNFRFTGTSDNERYGSGVVTAGRTDSVFRHTMGEHSSGGPVHGIGVATTSLGILGALVGASLLGTGALIQTSDTNGSGSGSGLTTGGGVTLGIGLVAIGIGMMVASPTTNQEGSSTQFANTNQLLSGESKPSKTSGQSL